MIYSIFPWHSRAYSYLKGYIYIYISFLFLEKEKKRIGVVNHPQIIALPNEYSTTFFLGKKKSFFHFFSFFIFLNFEGI
jgi:hypothetical protein